MTKEKGTKSDIFTSKALTYFVDLTKSLSYTQTAQLLGITQPALTQQIKKLEKSVGAPLFYSVGKKIQLTDAGNTLLKMATEILEKIHVARDEIQHSTTATSGRISIGVLASMEDSVIEEFVTHHFKEVPEVKIDVYLLTRRDIWERLENNKIDLAIMYLPDENIKNWKPYKIKKIIDDDMLFIHSNDNLAEKKKIKLKDTLDNDWVGYVKSYYLNELIQEKYKNELIDVPKASARFSSPYQILRFANNTGSYAALPTSFVTANLDNMKGYQAHFDPNISSEMAFVYRKDKDQIPRIKNFFGIWDRYLHEKDYLTRLRETKTI
ncbi:transcriptional regulator [Companilactobacillus sp. RD055328]|uniref:LysR family transcriptional regulator n=1 Tax=Companilactobacillus sp. RD055328 TaxID=2916634 RepID=UPI001FC7DA03|nr:LysR family transcriptional regulator [Companilactobacillus sp. RD055328]GKQ42710.1 transcriptional regulator [Companilactobacillus sp. RD055328]